MLVAQPAISSIAGPLSPAKKGWFTSRCSVVCMSAASRPGLGLDGRGLLGDVDGRGAPGDAAAAADAAGGAELVDPRGQLVRRPLPVARADGGAHAATVQV